MTDSADGCGFRARSSEDVARDLLARRVVPPEEGDRDTPGGAGEGTTESIRPYRMDPVVVLRGGYDPLGPEVDGVEAIRDFATRPETPGPAPAPAPAAAPPASESTGTTAPAPGRMWAGIVKDERGEIGVLDTDAVFVVVAALAKKGEESQALEVGVIG